MNTVYLATAESRNFSFQAVGNTEQSATDSLMRGLRIHAEQYGLDNDWHIENADIRVEDLILGEVYRDGSQMREETE